MLNENRCFKWRCVTWCWFSCAQECKFLLLVKPFTANWALTVNRLSERTGSCDCSLQKIAHIWCYVPVQGGVLCDGNTDRKHLCAKFSLPMSVPYLSCNFCVYSYLGFVALLRERYLRAVFFQVLNSLVVRSKSLSEFRVLFHVLQCGTLRCA